MKNLNMKITLTILFSILAIGCQSDPKTAACAGNDWFELGRREGAAGKQIKPEEITLRCEAAFDTNAQNLYSLGYNNGLNEYCSYENGYSLGRSGSKLLDVCPRPSDELFKAAHARGLKARELEAANQQIDRKISSVSERLKTTSSDHPEKKNLMSEINGLRQEKIAIEKRLQKIEKNVN